MTSLTASLIAMGIQSGLVIALAADKWVHKVTGATPLEGRIAQIEKLIENGNARSSKKASELTVYLDTRREAFDRLSERVAAIEGALHMLGPLPDDRRRR